MAAPPAAQQAVQDALLAHDRIRRSTDLPLFYGVPGKDTVSAKTLVDRLQVTAGIAGWNDKRTAEAFYLLLRDEALIWWKTIKLRGIDQESFTAIKPAFLKYYEPKLTATTSCQNLVDLHQKSGEPVHRYFLRIHDALDKFSESRPPLAAVAHVPAAPIVANDLVEAKKEGALEQEMFMRLQLFIAGLQDRIRVKVMEANKATLGETVDFAIELERISQRSEPRRLNAIGEEDGGEEGPASPEDWDDDELAAINAIRFKKGKAPYHRSGPRPGFKKEGPAANGSPKCRYCKKPGHLQKVCRSRIRDKAPMVDQDGKPYTRKVFNVTQGTDAPEEKSISLVWDQDQERHEAHLNW